jgi:hypothetical protein
MKKPRFRMTIGQMMVAILGIGIVLAALVRLPGAVPIAVVLGYIFGPIVLLRLMRGKHRSFPPYGPFLFLILALPEILLALYGAGMMIVVEQGARSFTNISDFIHTAVIIWVMFLAPTLFRFYLEYIFRRLIEAMPPHCPVCGEGRLRLERRIERNTRRWVDSEYSRCPRCGGRGKYSDGDRGPTWEPINPDVEMVTLEDRPSESRGMQPG